MGWQPPHWLPTVQHHCMLYTGQPVESLPLRVHRASAHPVAQAQLQDYPQKHGNVAFASPLPNPTQVRVCLETELSSGGVWESPSSSSSSVVWKKPQIKQYGSEHWSSISRTA